MTQNIEQRTEAAVTKYEKASEVVDKLGNTDSTVETPVGKRDSFPKLSREIRYSADEQHDLIQERADLQYTANQNSHDNQMAEMESDFQNRFHGENQYLAWESGITVSDRLQVYTVGTLGVSGYKELLPNPELLPFVTGTTIDDDLSLGRWSDTSNATKKFAQDEDKRTQEQIFKREIVDFDIGEVFGPYSENGVIYQPRLRYAGVHYVTIDLNENITFASAPVDNRDGTITVTTDKGSYIFSSFDAESITRDDLNNLFDSYERLLLRRNLKAGMRVKTSSYHTGLGYGGGEYLISDTATPDGLIDRAIGNTGLVAVLQNDGNIYVEQAGARRNVDDDSFSDALQAIVLKGTRANSSLGNFPKKTNLSGGRYYANHAVFMDAFDGMAFEGVSKLITQIEISPSFDVTIPQWFADATLGDGNDYNKLALFIVAQSRITNLHDGYLPLDRIPARGTAAVSYGWYRFYFCADKYGGGEKKVDLVYCPQLAGSKFSEIIGNGAKRLLTTKPGGGCYLSVFEDIGWNHCYQPVFIDRGTTLDFRKCSSSHTDIGWEVYSNYSTFNDVSCDHWAYGCYAWSIGGTGVTLTGCGCEYGYGGVFELRGNNETEVTVTGCSFIGGSLFGDINWTGQASESDFGVDHLIKVDKGKLTTIATTWRNIVEPTEGNKIQLNAPITGGGVVTEVSRAGDSYASYMQRKQWVPSGSGTGGAKSDYCALGQKAAFRATSKADFEIVGTDSITVALVNAERPIDTGFPYFDALVGLYPKEGDVTQYRAPYAGRFQVTFTATIQNAHPSDYIYIDGYQNPNYPISLATGESHVSFTDIVDLKAGQTIMIKYRFYGQDAIIKSGAILSGQAI